MILALGAVGSVHDGGPCASGNIFASLLGTVLVPRGHPAEGLCAVDSLEVVVLVLFRARNTVNVVFVRGPCAWLPGLETRVAVVLIHSAPAAIAIVSQTVGAIFRNVPTWAALLARSTGCLLVDLGEAQCSGVRVRRTAQLAPRTRGSMVPAKSRVTIYVDPQKWYKFKFLVTYNKKLACTCRGLPTGGESRR